MVYSIYSEGDFFNQILASFLVMLNNIFDFHSNQRVMTIYYIVISASIIFSFLLIMLNSVKKEVGVNSGNTNILDIIDFKKYGLNIPIIKIFLFYIFIMFVFTPVKTQLIKPVPTTKTSTFAFKVEYPNFFNNSSIKQNNRYFYSPRILAIPAGIINYFIYGIPVQMSENELSNNLDKVYEVKTKYSIFSILNNLPFLHKKLGDYDVLQDTKDFKDYMAKYTKTFKNIKQGEELGNYLYKIPYFYGISYGQQVMITKHFQTHNAYSKDNFPEKEVENTIKDLPFVKNEMSDNFSFTGIFSKRLNDVLETTDDGFTEKELQKNFNLIISPFYKIKYAVDWNNLMDIHLDDETYNFGKALNKKEDITNTDFYNSLKKYNTENGNKDNNLFIFFNNYFYNNVANINGINGDKNIIKQTYFNNYETIRKNLLTEKIEKMTHNDNSKYYKIRNNLLLNAILEFAFNKNDISTMTNTQKNELSRCIGIQNQYNTITKGCQKYSKFLTPNITEVNELKKTQYNANDLNTVYDFDKKNLDVTVNIDKLKKEYENTLENSLKPLANIYSNNIKQVIDTLNEGSGSDKLTFFSNFLSNYTEEILFDSYFLTKGGTGYELLFKNKKDNLKISDLSSNNLNISGVCDGVCKGNIFTYFKLNDNDKIGINKIINIDNGNGDLDTELNKLTILQQQLNNNLQIKVNILNNYISNPKGISQQDWQYYSLRVAKLKLELNLVNKYKSFLESGLQINTKERLLQYKNIMELTSQLVKMDIVEFYNPNHSLISENYLNGYIDVIKMESGLINSIYITPMVTNLFYYKENKDTDGRTLSEIIKHIIITYNIDSITSFDSLFGYLDKDKGFIFGKGLNDKDIDYNSLSLDDKVNQAMTNFNDNAKNIKNINLDNGYFSFNSDTINKYTKLDKINYYSKNIVEILRNMFRMTYDMNIKALSDKDKIEKLYNQYNELKGLSGFHFNLRNFDGQTTADIKALYLSQFLDNVDNNLFLQNLSYINLAKKVNKINSRNNDRNNYNFEGDFGYNIELLNNSVNLLNKINKWDETQSSFILQKGLNYNTLIGYHMYLQVAYYGVEVLSIFTPTAIFKGAKVAMESEKVITNSEKIVSFASKYGEKIAQYGGDLKDAIKTKSITAIEELKKAPIKTIIKGTAKIGILGGTIEGFKSFGVWVLNQLYSFIYYIGIFIFLAFMGVVMFFYTIWKNYLIPILFLKVSIVINVIKVLFGYFKVLLKGDYSFSYISNFSKTFKEDIIKLISLMTLFLLYMCLVYIIMNYTLYLGLELAYKTYLISSINVTGIALLLSVLVGFWIVLAIHISLKSFVLNKDIKWNLKGIFKS